MTNITKAREVSNQLAILVSKLMEGIDIGKDVATLYVLTDAVEVIDGMIDDFLHKGD